MELIALKSIADSVGSLSVGQEFEASSENGEELIRSGQACLRTEYFGQVTEGRWSGSTVVIIGGGPSIQKDDFEVVHRWYSEGLALDYNRRVVVTNTSYQFAPWADALYGADHKWWELYWPDVQVRFAGEKWTQAYKTHKAYGVRMITCERRDGLSRLRGVIHHGGNSGYQAIGLAYEFGAKKLILVGFDMQKTFGKTHHHGDHPKPLSQSGPYSYWIPNFNKLAIDLKRAGVQVINATRVTALKCFEQRSLEEALSDA